MGGAYGTPCAGELRYWDVMRAQIHELVKQTTRIADALEANNLTKGIPSLSELKALAEAVEKDAAK